MNRFIVRKKDLHLIPKRSFIDATTTMASNKIITETDNLVYSNLDFVAICLTEKEQQIFKNAGAEITESKPQSAMLGRWNGAGIFQPIAGKYPFVEMGFDKYDNKNIAGRGVKVGVMDTGVNQSASCTVEYGVNLTSADPSFADNFNHGGHITFMCKSSIWGAIPKSTFHMVKCITDGGSIDESLFLAGVNYCITNRLDLVNMSFQLSASRSLMQSAIDSLLAVGCLPICAGGNSGAAAELPMPASCFGAVAVGASAPNYTIASFSSLQKPSDGQGLTILAPGENVPVGGENGTSLGNGTSYSSPYIMCALACIMEEHGVSNIKALSILKANAVKSSNSLLGSGFLNCP